MLSEIKREVGSNVVPHMTAIWMLRMTPAESLCFYLISSPNDKCQSAQCISLSSREIHEDSSSKTKSGGRRHMNNNFFVAFVPSSPWRGQKCAHLNLRLGEGEERFC